MKYNKNYLDKFIDDHKDTTEWDIEFHLLSLTESLCDINKQTKLFHLKLWIIEKIVDNLSGNKHINKG